jgi:light-regulated signal transduction histidine kinase (bacteriophytochrome)
LEHGLLLKSFFIRIIPKTVNWSDKGLIEMVKNRRIKESVLQPVTTETNVQNLLRKLQQCKADLELRQEELRAAQTGQKQAQERLREKDSELTCANNELDAFIGSVTHGLRNSLQTITGFSQTLLKFYYDSLDETGRDCLTRIGAGTKKMKAIIESLVELSRISGKEMKREKVNLSEIALSFCSTLKTSDPHRIVECAITPDLIADADPELARVLMENLLQNAWKFTSKNDHALIEFGVMHGKKGQEFFVRDNGVGFDPGHMDKLFKPLQYLHKEEAFKGPGTGLAAVKRIMCKHGGCVRAEAEKGKGAAFYFQFSKA